VKLTIAIWEEGAISMLFLTDLTGRALNRTGNLVLRRDSVSSEISATRPILRVSNGSSESVGPALSAKFQTLGYGSWAKTAVAY
jgi:hypothetical protein